MEADLGTPSREQRGGLRWLLGALGVSLLLHAPSLGWGFYADDYGHQLVLRGLFELPTMEPWSLYDFGHAPEPGDPLWESGSFPFWTAPDWKGRFFRPLTSLTLMLDHALHGERAVGYHADGLVLFAVLLCLVYGLARALGLSPRLAALAVLIFGCEDGGAIPVGWIANRNTLLEALFTTASVLVLLRHDPTRRWWALAIALVLALAAALSKESGVMAFALVALYLHRRGRSVDSTWARTGIAAACLLALGHLIFFFGAGYGLRSAFYPTPWGDPLRFLGRLAVLGPVEALAMTSSFPPDLFALVPGLFAPGMVVGAALGLPLVVFVWRRVRSHPAAGFLAAWTVLTLLPQAGAPISDRLIFVPMVGAAPLLAIFFARTLVRVPERSKLALLLFATAVPLSALGLLAKGLHIIELAGLTRAIVLETDVGPQSLGPREVLVLQSPGGLPMLSPLSVWAVETGDRDVRFWPLQSGRRAIRWKRIDQRTCEVESLERPFLTDLFEIVFLTVPAAFPTGHVWSTALFEVEATRTDDEGLRAFRVRFTEENADLDDERFRFVTWRDGRLLRIAPPAVGEELVLEGVTPPVPFFP